MGGPPQPGANNLQSAHRSDLSSERSLPQGRMIMGRATPNTGIPSRTRCLYRFRILLFGHVWTMNVEFLCPWISVIDLVTRPTIHGETAQTRFTTAWSLSVWPSGIIRPWSWSTSINSPYYISCLVAMQGISSTARILPPCLPLHSRALARQPSRQISLAQFFLFLPHLCRGRQSENTMPFNPPRV